MTYGNRRLRQEHEEESREAKRIMEKRFSDELESVRGELTLARRKVDELTAETDSTKRRLMLSKEDGS
jgi:polyhydroxyalkanoate synthesis regulator phasin